MRLIALGGLVAAFSVGAAVVSSPPAAPPLSAAQIIEKNVAARGGLQAWRNIQTMTWIGRVEDSRASAPPMPFLLELKRPNKTRFEIATLEQRFARIFDGARGWRMRPGGNGVPEVKPFSDGEVAYSRDEYVIDGPLVDYEAKGINVKLAGVDEIEGRRAYMLELRLPSGASRRVWIDTQSFLEIRADRPSTNPLVKGAPVSVYYSDYRTIDGVLVPHTIETRSAAGGQPPQRLIIDKVAVNPSLPDLTFAKPQTPRQRSAVVRIGGDSGAPPPPGIARPSP